MRKLIATTTFVGSSLVALGASASGFSTARFGGEHGTPMADNPSVIYYNPAALSSYPGLQIMADANLAYRIAGYERSSQTLPNGQPSVTEPDCVAAGTCPPTNTGDASLTNFAAAPMLGASLGIPIGENRLAFGAAFFVPFGGSASWSKNDAWDSQAPRPSDDTYWPGAADGTQRWYSIDGTIRTLYVSAGAAFSIMDIVHLGVSGGLAIDEIDSIRARTATGAGDDVAAEGRTWLESKGMFGQLGGGVLVTPLDDLKTLRIGLSYQAPPGFGRHKQKGLLRKNLGGLVQGDRDPEDSVVVYQNLPDVFRFGASFRPMENLELRAFGDVTRWSLFREQCIAPAKGSLDTATNAPRAADAKCDVLYDDPDGAGPLQPGRASDDSEIVANLPRRWKDAGGVRVGMSYWASDVVEVFAGLGYDSNAIPDFTLDPALTDFHDVSVALGGRFNIVKQFKAAIGYTHLFYVPRDTTDSAQSNIDYNNTSTGPDNRGRYTQTIGVFNIHLIANFDPFDESAPAPAPAE